MNNLATLFAVLALPAVAGFASAEPSRASDPSAFALPISEAVSPDLALTASNSGFASAPPMSGTRYESIRYRPRRSSRPRYWDEDRASRSTSSSGYLQLHGGFFDPDGDVSNGTVFGARVGSSIDGRVQIGVGADVSHRSDHDSQVIGRGTLPGGGGVERRRDLSEVSSNLLPVMGFVQVTPGGENGGGPYVGIAGGYEALFVSAKDFITGEDFDATYDGWGWQLYGGFAFPLAPQARLMLEGFLNQADLDRDVDDPVSGSSLREVVNADGAGARFDVGWNF